MASRWCSVISATRSCTADADDGNVAGAEPACGADATSIDISVETTHVFTICASISLSSNYITGRALPGPPVSARSRRSAYTSGAAWHRKTQTSSRCGGIPPSQSWRTPPRTNLVHQTVSVDRRARGAPAGWCQCTSSRSRRWTDAVRQSRQSRCTTTSASSPSRLGPHRIGRDTGVTSRDRARVLPTIMEPVETEAESRSIR